jgi:hypothetical protein
MIRENNMLNMELVSLKALMGGFLFNVNGGWESKLEMECDMMKMGLKFCS